MALALGGAAEERLAALRMLEREAEAWNGIPAVALCEGEDPSLLLGSGHLASLKEGPGWLERLDALGIAADLIGEGYDVVLAADACGSRNPDNHATALAALRDLGCTVVPTETVVYRLLGAAGTPEFKALLPLFK